MTIRTVPNGTKCADQTVSVIPVEIALASTVMTLSVLFLPVERTSQPALNETMLLGFIGYLLFLAAKISLLTAGRFASWGPAPMRSSFKLVYFVGYALMALSTLVTFEKIL